MCIAREAEELENIYHDLVVPIEAERGELKEAVLTARQITEMTSLTKLMEDLTAAQDQLNEGGGALVVDLLVDHGNIIIKHVENYTQAAEKAIREDVGKCRPVFDAATTIVYGPCVYFLDPFNSAWFCFGWFVFFSIPSIIFAACMADSYRETKKGEGSEAKSISQKELIMLPELS